MVSTLDVQLTPSELPCRDSCNKEVSEALADNQQGAEVLTPRARVEM